MHTFNHITKIPLVIPGPHISHMCHRLTQLQEGLESARGAEISLDERERLPHLLGLLGWRTDWQSDGSLKLVEYTGESLDLENNPVLESAAGSVRAGCFIEGYGEGNVQWQIRYYTSSKQQVCGSIAFPRAARMGEAFSLDAHPARGQRCRPAANLSTLSPRALAFTQEQLLVAERGDKTVGFLAYHGEEGRTGVITHIATVVNGRRYGYPQALVTHLQHQFQELP